MANDRGEEKEPACIRETAEVLESLDSAREERAEIPFRDARRAFGLRES